MSDRGIMSDNQSGQAAMKYGGGTRGPREAKADCADSGEVMIEKDLMGKPHRGKIFVAIHAHLDDIPYYCAGTVAKLIKEGYTGYIIRTSNDEKCGEGTPVQNIKSNEAEHFKMAQVLGITDVFNFYYRNHRMNNISTQELRSRFVFLFRLLKVDTVLTFNPWGHGEENPDHWVTGRVAEEACWMAGMGNDYPEHMEAGLEPHGVKERYYFVARPGQPYNRVIDISSTIEQKIDAIAECKSQGEGNSGSKLRAKLAKEGKRLPILGDDDRTADREYIRHFLINEDKNLGGKYGLWYAEAFYYTDQRISKGQSDLDKYVEENAVPI
jgi:LmbE family N-acetylglucosaminyl deacetylase